jgi:hypothetical protein
MPAKPSPPDRVKTLELFTSGPWRLIALFLLVGEAILGALAMRAGDQAQVVLGVGMIVCLMIAVSCACYVAIKQDGRSVEMPQRLGADIEALQLSSNDYRLLFAVDANPVRSIQTYEGAISEQSSLPIVDRAIRLQKLGLISSRPDGQPPPVKGKVMSSEPTIANGDRVFITSMGRDLVGTIKAATLPHK